MGGVEVNFAAERVTVGFDPERASVEEMRRALSTENLREGVRMLPGANGGSEWSPTAFSPETGYLYVLALHRGEPDGYIVAATTGV